jgi:peptidoglycan/xylan/chitin deacetylase (PgdA/CDA1 family)
MYHEVLDVVERQKHTRSMVPLYCLSVLQFRQQMEYLRDARFRAVTVEELARGEVARDEKSVAITFDDGLVGNHTFAFPILQQVEMKASFFVLVGSVGEAGYLGWEQAREMEQAGMVIGSHTLTHVPLENEPDEVVRRELGESKAILEDKLGSAVRHLSVPHGSIDARVVRIARESGYASICTSVLGVGLSPGHPTLIHRIPVLDTYDLKTFGRIVELDRRFIGRLALAKKLKNGLKRIIGIENYRRLYRWYFNIELAD